MKLVTHEAGGITVDAMSHLSEAPCQVENRPKVKARQIRSSRGTTLMAALAVVFASLVGGLTLFSETADAASVRRGARWDHIDVLLTREETVSAARSLSGGVAVCRGVMKTAIDLGKQGGGYLAITAAIASGSLCITTVTVCAAQANVRGRSAGMTFSPGRVLPNYWCWQY